MDLVQSGGPSRLPATSSRRPWTPEEDKALCAAVKKYGSDTGQGSSWAKISSAVGGRTNKDCRKRWFYTLDPSLRKGRWTREEDDTLRTAYGELGPQWREIASRIPGRNDEQVAKRWKDVLSPDLSLDTPWTPEEDLLLLNLFKELGPKWTPMSDRFPGRNGIACRNRFRKFKSSRTTTDVNGQSQDTLDLRPPSAAMDFEPANHILQDNHISQVNLKTNLTPVDPLNPEVITTSRRQSLILQQWLDATFGTDDNGFNFDQWPTTIEAHTNTGSESVQSQPPGEREPIADTLGLLVALDAGQETLTLTSGLVRQLLADASRS